MKVTFQSRNRICPPEASQHGWPCNLAEHPKTLQDLKTRVLRRFEDHNPEVKMDYTKPLIVAGEWIGPKIQKNVGVSELSHRFVILAFQINGSWQQDTVYADIEAPEAAIYSVLRVPQYVVEFDTNNLSLTNPMLLKMQRLADAVEEQCPFAAKFGIGNSMGEGIVWKPGVPAGRSDAKYWLKTKGPNFGPENRIKPSSGPDNFHEKILSVDSAAEKWFTPRRVEQGFEYLEEMQTSKPARWRTFVRWIQDDIMKEEKADIEMMEQQTPGFTSMLQRDLGRLASEAFQEHAK
ncbi:hypothetical protein LTS08_002686 [Lithohypha guttulata]|nr:hypothetical protein LTS08_002686 [Lithohypha guttulata]